MSGKDVGGRSLRMAALLVVASLWVMPVHAGAAESEATKTAAQDTASPARLRKVSPYAAVNQRRAEEARRSHGHAHAPTKPLRRSGGRS